MSVSFGSEVYKFFLSPRTSFDHFLFSSSVAFGYDIAFHFAFISHYEFLTLAALVLETTVLPLEPSLFFFLAVAANCLFDNLRAFASGKQRSGFFLSLLVPQGPFILPSVPIRTHFCSLHFLSSPMLFFHLSSSNPICLCGVWIVVNTSFYTKHSKSRSLTFASLFIHLAHLYFFKCEPSQCPSGLDVLPHWHIG